MTKKEAKTILAKDIRCRKKQDCYQRCVDCKNYVTDEQLGEAEKVILNWIDIVEEHEKQAQTKEKATD